MSSWLSWDFGHLFPMYDQVLSCSWAGDPCRHGDPEESRGSGEVSGLVAPRCASSLPGLRAHFGGSMVQEGHPTPATAPSTPARGRGGLVDTGTCSLSGQYREAASC